VNINIDYLWYKFMMQDITHPTHILYINK